MPASSLWCINISKDYVPFGPPFNVAFAEKDTISVLIAKVQNLFHNLNNVASKDLTVWRLTTPTPGLDEEGKYISSTQISTAFKENEVQALGSREELANLKLLKREVLFVYTPLYDTSVAAISKVWCLVIDRKNQILGWPFQVYLKGSMTNACVNDLATGAKETTSVLEHIKPGDLGIWRCKEPTLLATASVIQLQQFIDTFKISDENQLKSAERIDRLGLLQDEILLVRKPVYDTSMAAISKVWCLVVDHENQILGWPFQVYLKGSMTNACVYDLAKGAKETTSILEHIKLGDLGVWRCKEPTLLATASVIQLQQFIDTIKVSDENQLKSAERIDHLGLLQDEILFVRKPANLRDLDAQESADIMPRLRHEYERYKVTVNTKGKSPSEGAKSTGYRDIQQQRSEAIYDGVTVLDPPFSTVAPPIHIFHPIFDKFASMTTDRNLSLTTEDKLNVQKLMRAMSVLHPNEGTYMAEINAALNVILGQENDLIKAGMMGNNVMADGVVLHRDAVLVIEELKYFMGVAGDPSFQASVSMRRYWIDPDRKSIREKCCCPTFIIAAAGPWLCIMGGVFTDKMIVQRLTGFEWAALSSSEEEDRIINITRTLVALRNCRDELRAFYSGVIQTKFPPLLPDKPHPRFYPYPTRYTKNDGSHVTFQYIQPLESDDLCVTFLAEIVSGEKGVKNVVIKFVRRYGKDVHEYLASKGHAPKLYYSGSMQPAIECKMKMVVMEYMVGEDEPPADAYQQLTDILVDLHSNGFVFGDLRRPNTLFDKGDKVYLIDFNWCGRYDVSKKHWLPEAVRERIEAKQSNLDPIDFEGGYARYPLAMSNVWGMWADGMEAEADILPGHDWKMLDKLDF